MFCCTVRNLISSPLHQVAFVRTKIPTVLAGLLLPKSAEPEIHSYLHLNYVTLCSGGLE